MTVVDVLDMPGVQEVQGIPNHRVGNKAVIELGQKDPCKRYRGLIWASTCDVLKKLGEAHEVVVNTTREELLKGNYGGVFLDDGYWLVCDVTAYAKCWGYDETHDLRSRYAVSS